MDLENQLLDWASTQKKIEAVIKIGSRAQNSGLVDQWSDWDFQLICKSIKPYLDYNWETVFKSPIGCVNKCITPRGVPKITLIFNRGEEVELILLTAWQMKLLYSLMRYPSLYPKFPTVIQKGIYNLHKFVKSGYHILKGGNAWEKKLIALNNPIPLLPPKDLPDRATQFWTDATWIYKQIMRGNLHAAQKLFHHSLREQIYFLLEVDVNFDRFKCPRRMEHWVSPDRLEKISAHSAPERLVLTKALIAEINLFDELINSISRRNNVLLPNNMQLKKWLLAECEQILHSKT